MDEQYTSETHDSPDARHHSLELASSENEIDTARRNRSMFRRDVEIACRAKKNNLYDITDSPYDLVPRDLSGGTHEGGAAVEVWNAIVAAPVDGSSSNTTKDGHDRNEDREEDLPNSFKVPLEWDQGIDTSLLTGESRTESYEEAEGPVEEPDEGVTTGDRTDEEQDEGERFSTKAKGKWKALENQNHSKDKVESDDQRAPFKAPQYSRFPPIEMIRPLPIPAPSDDKWVSQNTPLLHEYANRQVAPPLGERVSVKLNHASQFNHATMQMLANRNAPSDKGPSRALPPQLLDGFMDLNRWASEYFRVRFGQRTVGTNVTELMTIITNNFYEAHMQLIDEIGRKAIENMGFRNGGTLEVRDFAFGFDLYMSQEMPFFAGAHHRVRQTIEAHNSRLPVEEEPPATIVTRSGRESRRTMQAIANDREVHEKIKRARELEKQRIAAAARKADLEQNQENIPLPEFQEGASIPLSPPTSATTHKRRGLQKKATSAAVKTDLGRDEENTHAVDFQQGSSTLPAQQHTATSKPVARSRREPQKTITAAAMKPDLGQEQGDTHSTEFVQVDSAAVIGGRRNSTASAIVHHTSNYGHPIPMPPPLSAPPHPGLSIVPPKRKTAARGRQRKGTVREVAAAATTSMHSSSERTNQVTSDAFNTAPPTIKIPTLPTLSVNPNVSSASPVRGIAPEPIVAPHPVYGWDPSNLVPPTVPIPSEPSTDVNHAVPTAADVRHTLLFSSGARLVSDSRTEAGLSSTMHPHATFLSHNATDSSNIGNRRVMQSASIMASVRQSGPGSSVDGSMEPGGQNTIHQNVRNDTRRTKKRKLDDAA